MKNSCVVCTFVQNVSDITKVSLHREIVYSIYYITNTHSVK